MWDFIPSCFRRHKKKLLFLSGVVGGITLYNTYFKKKFLEWEAQRLSDKWDQLGRSGHFESAMNNCDSVFMNFSKKIRCIVSEKYNVETIVEQLRKKEGDKVELWEKLKIYVFTQMMGDMYVNCILCILLRVQMSILSGYIFSTCSTSSSATDQLKKCMSHIEEFMMNGVCKLLEQIEDACKSSLKEHDLNKLMRLQDIESIILSIHSKFSENILNTFFTLVVDANDKVNDKNLISVNIFVETKDLLECNDFKKVLDLSVSCGISYVMDMLSGIYANVSGKEQFKNINIFEIKLAKLIPLMNNQFSNQELTHSDSFAHKIIQLEKLNNFAANIYEAFSQK